jgi:PAS domain S-box-containing protein
MAAYPRKSPFCILLVLAIQLLVFPAGLNAQQYNISTYNTTSGLPDNRITSLLQDKYGKLWIGTLSGLCTYDGSAFSRFDKGNPVYDNPITSLFEDSKGNIWIGTIRKGVCKFSGTSFEFYNTTSGLLSDNVNSITEDRSGNIWIGTSEGLNRYDGKYFHSYTSLRGLVNNNILSVTVDSKGRLWICTLGGISILEKGRFRSLTTDDGLLSNITYHASQSPSGSMWIGTYLGISVHSKGTFRNYTRTDGLPAEKVERIIHLSDTTAMASTYGGGVLKITRDTIIPITVEDGLPSNIVKTVLKDREGNFWIATWNGLCKFAGDAFIGYTTEDGLTSNNILSIASDSLGTLWMGTVTGGLNYYDGKSFGSFSTSDGLKSSTIWSITVDERNDLWLGTTNGPAVLSRADMKIRHPFPFFDNSIIYSILKDSRGRKLLATDKGIYITEGETIKANIGTEQGLLNDKVRVLFEDKAGTVWVGTYKGLFYLKDDLAYSYNDPFGLPAAPVTSIIQDSKGRIIVSTYDFGVYVISDKTKKPDIILNTSTGLFNNRILFCFIDNNNLLWMGSPGGLDAIDWNKPLNRNNTDVWHFDKSNGYPGIETNAACSDGSDNIWFASVNGIIRHKGNHTDLQLTLPLLRITNIQLFRENVDWRKKKIPVDEKSGLPKELTLGYNNNYITFAFSGIYLTAPSEVRYEFILEGNDENWTRASSQNTAYYSNLSPGSYTFKVRATANGRNWTPPVTYSFEIKPPYWKTPFFYFLYAVTVIGSIFLFLKIRTQSLQRTQNLLRQKVEQRTRELNEKNLELEKLSIVASETDNAVLILNNEKNIEWANSGFQKMTGYTVAEFNQLFRNPGTSFAAELADALNLSISSRQSCNIETNINRKEGGKIWISSTLTPIFSADNQLKKVVVISTDITVRRMMEEQIRESLEEKGLLLREIHHRVKNNLQIIISLFNLQSHYIDDLKASEALKEGQDRIKSMALIHERFYQNEGQSRIDFDEYIKRLTENLFLSFSISPDRIKTSIDTEKVSLDIDSAVPCGLIINEVVSNALKHAFGPDETGEISILFKRNGEKGIHLVISDNGRGLPPGFDPETADSLGMQLINALTSQLDGKMTFTGLKGTTFTLDFNIVN